MHTLNHPGVLADGLKFRMRRQLDRFNGGSWEEVRARIDRMEEWRKKALEEVECRKRKSNRLFRH